MKECVWIKINHWVPYFSGICNTFRQNTLNIFLVIFWKAQSRQTHSLVLWYTTVYSIFRTYVQIVILIKRSNMDLGPLLNTSPKLHFSALPLVLTKHICSLPLFTSPLHYVMMDEEHTNSHSCFVLLTQSKSLNYVHVQLIWIDKGIKFWLLKFHSIFIMNVSSNCSPLTYLICFPTVSAPGY